MLTTYRVSVPKFDRMRAEGFFGDDKVELLRGVLTMMTTGPDHDNAVLALADGLRACLPSERWTIREEKSVMLGTFWKPVPDVTVVRGPRSHFAGRTPGPGDIALIVEVSDTTYAKDAGIKLRRYERSGLATYWIVDLSRRRIEVREMTAKGLTHSATHGEDEEVPVVLDGPTHGRIAARDVLP